MEFVKLELTPEEILGKTPEALEKLKSLPPEQAESLGMFLVLVHIRYNKDEWIGEILYWLDKATDGEDELRWALREMVADLCQLIEANLLPKGFYLSVQQMYNELEEDGKINLNWI
jgi:hypothetical protein